MVRYLAAIFLLFSCATLCAQEPPGLVADFNFDHGELKDTKGGLSARAYGVSKTRDRFGNPDHAYYLQGNPDCYINLGTSSLLKQRRATISLWVKVLQPLHKGRGADHNPILLTKAHDGEECDEAFYIGYHLNLKNINVNTSYSCEKQITLYPTDSTELRRWHHVAITYNDSVLSFYLNGVLENSAAKQFPSRFLASDSVLVGIRTGEKNERFLNGCVDDVRFYDRVLGAEEIKRLYEAPDPNKLSVLYRWLKVAALVLLGIFALVWGVKWRIRYVIRKERESAHLQNTWYEQESRVLSAQMDPHFIFNSLNTIQHFIVSNENEKAQNYLSKFARLLRKMIESNAARAVSLAEEIDICRRYLEIESIRFNNVFHYRIHCDEALDQERTMIPHFLIQPLLENAIWHGLLPKDGEKNIMITIEKIDDSSICWRIDDDGVGRSASPARKPLPANRRSFAIQFITQRLELLSKLRNGNYGLKITDKKNKEGASEGTTVSVTMPIDITQKKHAESNNY